MGLVPFKSRTTPAGYNGASGPASKGRMPKRMTTPSIQVDSAPDPTKTYPAPPVDGAAVKHDTNYPRQPKEQHQKTNG